MSQFNSFDEKRHTAIYVRISTATQKTDRQQEGKRGQHTALQISVQIRLFDCKKQGAGQNVQLLNSATP